MMIWNLFDELYTCEHYIKRKTHQSERKRKKYQTHYFIISKTRQRGGEKYWLPWQDRLGLGQD